MLDNNSILEYLNPDWHEFLKAEITKPYFENLMITLHKEYFKNECYPPKELIFNAFNQCKLNDLKIIVVGQDPYHGLGEANGLSFSVNHGAKIPPSLRNIYREISSDFNTVLLPNSGDLSHWSKQGVLLLNATLTVKRDQPNSHKHLNWQEFTNAVIENLSNKKEGLVFMLWGSFAKKKGEKIDRTRHLVLESGHPSPMSANQGKWFGNKHFSLANQYLIERKKTCINWL
jgi:uracil-DNA glycosylase